MVLRVGQSKLLYNRLFVSVIFILCIFTPEFKHIPHIYTWILSFLGIMALANKSFVSYIGFFRSRNLSYWVYLIICFIAVIIPPIFNQTGDYSYLQIVAGIMLSSFRGVLLLYMSYRINSRDMMGEYCKHFIRSCNVYVIFTLLFIVIPSFKEFWLNNVIEDTYTSDYYYYQFRYSLNGFAGFSAASILSFCCLVCGYLLAKDEKLNRTHIIQFTISSVGCFFYGRIAIVGIVLGIAIFILEKKDFTKVSKILGIIVLIAGALLLLLNYLSGINEEFFYWRRWAFAILRQFFVEHNITDYSYNHLLNDMYFLPKFSTLLFGDGYYTDPYTGRYYMSTDVGYMRIILYTGVFGMLFLFGVCLYIFVKSYKEQTKHVNKVFIIFTIVLWLILEGKGESYQRILLLWYPLFLTLVQENKNEIEIISS